MYVTHMLPYYTLLAGTTKSANSVDDYGNTTHWASKAFVLLTPHLLTKGTEPSIDLMPLKHFRLLWKFDEGCRCWFIPRDSSSYFGSDDLQVQLASDDVPRALDSLPAAYGGLHYRLNKMKFDLTNCHYMLKGWEKQDGTLVLKHTKGAKYFDFSDEERAMRAVAGWPGLKDNFEELNVDPIWDEVLQKINERYQRCSLVTDGGCLETHQRSESGIWLHI